MKIRSILLSILTGCLFVACSQKGKPKIQSGKLTLSYNDSLYTNVHFSNAKEPLMAGFQPSEILRTDNQTVKIFKLQDYHTQSFTDNIGSGKRLIIEGLARNKNYSIKKKVIATVYDNIPNFISTRVEYYNKGKNTINLAGWDNNRYTLQPLDSDSHKHNFWSFQTGTYPSRPDWVLPVDNDFKQQNYLGMNASDYGGGTPVVDLWRPDAGLAVGHVEMTPQLVSLPVDSKDLTKGARLEVQFDVDSVSHKKYKHSIAPGDSISTFDTFLSAHTGDYFAPLRTYRNVLAAKGMKFSKPPKAAYQPIWCAWGYGRDFTLQKVLNTLPKVKELGFKWVVLDDGWQRAEGDWRTNNKFNGMSMKNFVDKIHSYGLKAKLWWTPLAADPGSKTYEQHPDMLLVNKEGHHERISWWNSDYLDPALQETQSYTTDLVKKFMDDWGFDGLKIDGQHLNQVPPDYGHGANEKLPAEKATLEYPEKSVEQLPTFFKKIYETAQKIKSEAVVEICPCGTSASSFIMPYMNQPVASDPLDSWQIRLKGKTYKAIMGDDVAYYGDHVELSDNGTDFASTVGIGGVIGTKFTWPKSSSKSDNKSLLTDQKEALVKKWMKIYKQNMLPKGHYLGRLYDIGFDHPETHVIEKNDKMYYAFYSDSFDGTIELRGLKPGVDYSLTNYETGEDLGTVEGPKDQLKAHFTKHLMVEATPKK